MIRAVSVSIAALSAYAATNQDADLVTLYDTLASEASVLLTAEEKEFHVSKFIEYMKEGSKLRISPMAMFEDALPVITAETAKELSSTSSFKSNSSFFSNHTTREARTLMGRLGEINGIKYNACSKDDEIEYGISYDASVAHPECPMIGFARDQGNCGSCWAMATVSAFNDRYCIASKGGFTKLLSTLHMVSCTRAGSCRGGWEEAAWNALEMGVPTGGEFEEEPTGETCKPYSFHKCTHHSPNATKYPLCSQSDISPDGQQTPKCAEKCTDNKFSGSLKEDMRKAKRDTKEFLYCVEDIKESILTYGPVTAAFNVFQDFLLYESGVYTRNPKSRGSLLGGHAIKVIGWGVEEGSGLEYWIAMNSWNESWGENGGRFRVSIRDDIFGDFFAGRPEVQARDMKKSDVSSIRM